jgi:hypothetical protein
MAEIFRCKDRDGIVVICNQGTWENHIVAEHPEMKGCEAYVKVSIERPYQICQNGIHPDEKNIYKPFILPRPYNTQYLRVGVKYHKKRLGKSVVGYVKTAFPCKGRRASDIVIWEEL